ncbi:MAG: STAS/SEC14 domain-containing protein [Candidatus Korobacteraceae bacterium]|jgi:stage II sporulation SpoAA-like protein
MSVELRELDNGKLLEVHLTGKLVKTDYEAFLPVVERLVKQHGKLLMLVEFNDFHGWTGSALWEDIKFDAKHFNDIERLAIIGENKWEKGMAAFCKPFTTAKVRYFDHTNAAEARDWLVQQLGNADWCMKMLSRCPALVSDDHADESYAATRLGHPPRNSESRSER